MAVLTDERSEYSLGFPALRRVELLQLLRDYCEPGTLESLNTDGMTKDALVGLMNGLVAQGKLPDFRTIRLKERGEAAIPASVQKRLADQAAENTALQDRLAKLEAMLGGDEDGNAPKPRRGRPPKDD